MIPLQGFWSYVHADDEAEGGRISRLARDVAAQFEMLTGERLDLFLDRDSLDWGEVWREKIDGALASVAFFIPVLTPRYFMSPECRGELQSFARRASTLGVTELVLPLHYVEVPALRQDRPEDDLVQLVQRFQWVDWTELRFVDVTSESYRRGVAKLAQRLVDANRHAESVVVPPTALTSDILDVEEEDQPGFLDRVASAESSLPILVETINNLAEDIQLVGEEMRQATAEVERGDQHSPGFAVRLLVARKLAQRLAAPADRILSLGNDYATRLHDVDQGFRAIIERAPEEIESGGAAREQICRFFQAVRDLSVNAHAGLTSAKGMIDAIAPIEKMSRDLRPALRRLRQGLTTMVEARSVSDEWVQLIQETGIVCEDLSEAGERAANGGAGLRARPDGK